MDFKEELNVLKEKIDKELEKSIKFEMGPHEKIFKSMKYSLLSGGKRIRPIISIKACELVGGNIYNVLPFALALEMIHTYSLIHDDLPSMDDDKYRRGKLTNHKVYGEAIAILAGDALLNYAYETMINNIVSEKDSSRMVEAFQVIAKASGVYGMVGGQVADILSEGKKINKNELDFIHKNKTSALIEAAITCGAIIGGAEEKQLYNLKNYGKAIGLCFQIRDDILDCIGDEKKLGKDIGSDIDNDKITYVSIYGIEQSIRKTNELCNVAISYLSDFDTDKVQFFVNLAKYLVYRDK